MATRPYARNKGPPLLIHYLDGRVPIWQRRSEQPRARAPSKTARVRDQMDGRARSAYIMMCGRCFAHLLASSDCSSRDAWVPDDADRIRSAAAKRMVAQRGMPAGCAADAVSRRYFCLGPGGEWRSLASSLGRITIAARAAQKGEALGL